MVFKALRKRSRKLTKRRKEAKQQPPPEEDHPLKHQPALYPPPPKTFSSASSRDVAASTASTIPVTPKKQSREIATQTSPCPSQDFGMHQLQDDRDPSARGSPSRQAHGGGGFTPTTAEGSDFTPSITIWASRNEDEESDLDDISRAETGASSMYDTEYSHGDGRTTSVLEDDFPSKRKHRSGRHSMRTVSMSESSSISLMDQLTDEGLDDTTNREDGTATLTEEDTMTDTLAETLAETFDDSMVDQRKTSNRRKKDWDEYLCPKPEYKVCGMTF